MHQALDNDLIAAVATPPGQGGVGIVRISGTGARELGQQICGRELKPRFASYCHFRDHDEVVDQGLALFFSDNASFTGEEVVELQGHGGPVVMQRLLDLVCRLGARLARPGEFSERAFLNGKMDLTQAEAVADLISSTSVAAARAAVNSLQGAFSIKIHASADALSQLRVLVEACIDFPDEDIDFLEQGQVKQKVTAIVDGLIELRGQSQQGQLLNEGISVALIGQPNVGKSSLLNCLSGDDAAIVTDIPGTTRDLLKVDMVLNGLPIKLVDTAGLRDSADQVEQLGVARARDQAQRADLVLLVLDGASTVDPTSIADELLSGLEIQGKLMVVVNKIDLIQLGSFWSKRPEQLDGLGALHYVSAKHHEGVDDLAHAISQCMGFYATEVPFVARARHIAALDTAIEHLHRADGFLVQQEATEIIAEELKAAHSALGEIVGTVTPDELLGKIFSEFCIGK